MIALTLAITIDDITVVFDFAGAVGSTLSFLIFPSVAYITALNRYGTSRIRQKRETMFYLTLSYVFIVAGVAIMASYIYVQFLKLIGNISEDQAATTA